MRYLHETSIWNWEIPSWIKCLGQEIDKTLYMPLIYLTPVTQAYMNYNPEFDSDAEDGEGSNNAEDGEGLTRDF